MAKFVYFRNATDDAYLNSVENFRGMSQEAGDTVLLYFTAATDSTGNTGFDKITITTTSNKEKEAMEGIAAAIAGSSSKNVTTVCDDATGAKCDDHISVVAGITRNAAGVGFTAVTADTTLTGADTGKIVQVNPAATTLIQLPGAAVAGAGWNVRIVLTEDDGGAMDQIVNIGTLAGEFFNGIIVGADAGGSVIANGTSNDFIQCKATATSGEEFFIYSDGTRMHCSGIAIDVSDTLFADAAAA